MSLAELTRTAVLSAIAEFDRLGRGRFLEKYGFGKARSYFLIHGGKAYDSKAIAGAAHGYLPERTALPAADFSGGEATVRARLTELDFDVAAPSPAPVPVVTREDDARRPTAPPVGKVYVNVGRVSRAAARDPFAVDPDKVDRGNQAHASTVDALADHLRARGIVPKVPTGADPEFDLAWEDNGALYVAEIKSVTDQNQEKQLRLGLGQVLRYRHLLGSGGRKVVAVLVAEREPSDPSWATTCAEVDVVLSWPGRFDALEADELATMLLPSAS